MSETSPSTNSHPQFIRWPAVHELISLSKVHVIKLEKAGLFPKRIRLTANRVVWERQHIIEWIEQRRLHGAQPSPNWRTIGKAGNPTD
jgi:prophage regulatory protein